MAGIWYWKISRAATFQYISCDYHNHKWYFPISNTSHCLLTLNYRKGWTKIRKKKSQNSCDFYNYQDHCDAYNFHENAQDHCYSYNFHGNCKNRDDLGNSNGNCKNSNDLTMSMAQYHCGLQFPWEKPY